MAEPDGEVVVVGTPRRPLFFAVNRGIVVSAVYAALLGAVLLGVLSRLHADPRAVAATFACLGLIAGAIGGFSNTRDDEHARRDLIRNLLDAAMIVVWSWLLVLLANLALGLAPALDVLRDLGAFAVGALVGGLAGEPVLAWIGRTSIKGLHPFLFINHVTRNVERPAPQLVLRVLLQTAVAASLAALAFVAAVVVIALLAIGLALIILGRVLSDDDGGTYRAPARQPLPSGRGGGRSREVEGLFGNYTEHVDGRGDKVGESRAVEGLFGNYTEHVDGRGNKVGESRAVEGLFGNHTEHVDSRGHKVGESRAVESLFGNYTEHVDGRGHKTGESREVEGLFGNYTEHTEEK